MAAADALTVSEVDLQRIKQQGCGTSLRDRSIMRLPDLKAFTYPLPENVPVEISADSNNRYMGRGSVNAEGFVPPFVNQPQESGIEPSSSFMEQQNLASRGSSTVPALAFAGTGEISQLNEVTFGSPPILYKQIASSIVGEPVQSLDMETGGGSGTIRDTETPLGRAGVVGMDEMQNARELQRKLYGANRASNSGNFMDRCQQAVRGFLYDVIHYREASASLYASRSPEEVSSKEDWADYPIILLSTREGRGPFILFVIVSVVLLTLVIVIIARHARSNNLPQTNAVMMQPIYAIGSGSYPAEAAAPLFYTRPR